MRVHEHWWNQLKPLGWECGLKKVLQCHSSSKVTFDRKRSDHRHRRQAGRHWKVRHWWQELVAQIVVKSEYWKIGEETICQKDNERDLWTTDRYFVPFHSPFFLEIFCKKTIRSLIWLFWTSILKIFFSHFVEEWWWWKSVFKHRSDRRCCGRHTCLQFWRSEFEFHSSLLQFFYIFVWKGRKYTIPNRIWTRDHRFQQSFYHLESSIWIQTFELLTGSTSQSTLMIEKDLISRFCTSQSELIWSLKSSTLLWK